MSTPRHGVDTSLEEAAEKQYTGFLAKEPVVAAHLAAAAVGYVLTLLVTHGVITNTQASATAQQAIPLAAAALITAMGFVIRQFVTPAWKSATGRDLPTVILDTEDPDPDDVIPAGIDGPVTATQAQAGG